MKYSDKVKASKEVIEAITSLPKDGELKVTFAFYLVCVAVVVCEQLQLPL